jgi:threonine synthase
VKYRSTRGRSPEVSFREALMTGLAPDGGLYVPSERVEAASGPSKSETYEELAARVIDPFVHGEYAEGEIEGLIAAAYQSFDHAQITPVTRLGGDREWLLELFHGPTLAFKDIALQLLGQLFEHELAGLGTTMTVIGATSGDTGSAAISACAGRQGLEVFMLQPAGRVSEIQRKQMTTVAAPNIHNIAIDGTFDDCQRLVKQMFGQREFGSRHRLGAVNSINWARVMAQIVYYAYAAARLEGEVDFVVPTGNFGNVYAGHLARRMGFPIRRLIIATNANDILARVHETGTMEAAPVRPTVSPSMDIQVSSNFERLLFELLHDDPDELRRLMTEFTEMGKVDLPAEAHLSYRDLFAAGSAGEAETLATMKQVYEETGMMVDPHTAVGIAVGRRLPHHAGVPIVYLATAHPAKFPQAVQAATGSLPPIPGQLAGIMEAEEHLNLLPADLGEVMAFVDGNSTL